MLAQKLVVELKNGIKLAGNLEQVDENLNFHLSDIKVITTAPGAEEQASYFDKCRQVFIRGNVIRYVHMSKSEVDVEPLTEACKKEGKLRADKSQPK
jgi:U6 snRNA-associated Sm-like protein LSm2